MHVKLYIPVQFTLHMVYMYHASIPFYFLTYYGILNAANVHVCSLIAHVTIEVSRSCLQVYI